jgi:hypothetical protein
MNRRRLVRCDSEETKITRIWIRILTVCAIGLFPIVCVGELRVVVDQVGYETHAPKQALVVGTEKDHPQRFSLVDEVTGKTVLSDSEWPG